MKKKHYYIIGAVIVVLVIGNWVFSSRNKVTAPEITSDQDQASLGQENFESGQNESQDNSTATNQLPATKSALAVSTQIAGNSVTIDNLYLEKTGFIVIHQLNSGGNLGPIIGKSGLLKPGSGQDLLISAPVKAGTNYSAVIYADNGDNAFNQSSDKPVLQENGQPVAVSFQVGN